jgi:hypothetical protein
MGKIKSGRSIRQFDFLGFIRPLVIDTMRVVTTGITVEPKSKSYTSAIRIDNDRPSPLLLGYTPCQEPRILSKLDIFLLHTHVVSTVAAVAKQFL